MNNLLIAGLMLTLVYFTIEANSSANLPQIEVAHQLNTVEQLIRNAVFNGN